VFVQFHHPFKSELWIAGETPYCEGVVARLEAFSNQCGKPSIHFFGHTHGYSRGQSRDAVHLWINAATAAGNIDYWDEYAQWDYDEFTHTFDEYGFVVVEVEAGDDPTFTVQHISRGDEIGVLDNEIRDQVRIRRYNNTPNTPTPVSPVGADWNPLQITLIASGFIDSDGDAHQASHWQISQSCGDFEQPSVERWRQDANWYGDIDLQASDDLTDELVLGLGGGRSYCWRVRYRDGSLGWSDWSAPASFVTQELISTENLLLNPGAEEGTIHWSSGDGTLESLAVDTCDGVPAPFSGSRYFAVGGVCQNESDYGEAIQRVDVSAHAVAIATGEARVYCGGHLRNWSGNDQPEIQLIFRDAAELAVLTTEPRGVFETDWTLIEEWVATPPATRLIDFVIRGTRHSGTDNDCYFDDLTLVLEFKENR
jgi:hypothetical protein